MLHLPCIDTPQTAAGNRSITTGLSACTDAFARYLAERDGPHGAGLDTYRQCLTAQLLCVFCTVD